MIGYLRRLASKNKYFESLVYCGYLLYEKFQSLIFLLFRVFPIDKNKVVFCAMQGSRYGDNPYYISEVLRNSEKNYDIVWLLNENVDDPVDAGIRRVKHGSVAAIKELATACVWVDCNMKYSGFLKRKGQKYIQTWHGSYGLKKIGFDLGETMPLIDRRNFIYNAKNEDIMVSNSKRTTEIYQQAFRYRGAIIEQGSPRNDMLLGDLSQYREKVYKYFDLMNDTHIALYAPTYRNDYKTDDMRLDFDRLCMSLEKYYGGKWAVLVRLHYKNIEDAKEFINYSDQVKNATYYGVMQELLAVSDILITDYSSCMFDYATTRKPCFIYASDLKQYINDRGNYFSMDELPFPLAENNDQLEEIIRDFDEKKYAQGLEGLFARVGLNETGHASEAVADYIIDWMDNR